MDFLKDILGDELFGQIKTKIDAHNGDEANKEKQVKLGNLAGGEYVGKGKYDALQEALNGKDAEIVNANNLIAELKKASKGNEELQGKFTKYEQENERLQAELKETKIKSAIKVALLSEKAIDVDYLAYKLQEKLNAEGKTLDLDENEAVKGWDDMISGLKTQYPRMFEQASGTDGKFKRMDDGMLPGNDDKNTLTRSDILKKPYAERAALYAENPEAYREAMSK